MKQILTLGLALMLAFAASAQKDVTKFLGIPVDGSKSAMIQKLKAKGFTYNAKDDFLEGEFNGRFSHIYVVTNNNKVYRIMVTDARGVGEGEIKIRFNTLCRQFKKNDKYMPADYIGEFEIGEEDDISYEMAAHNKRYQAAYYQVNKSDVEDTAALSEYLLNKIAEEYPDGEFDKLGDEEKRMFAITNSIEYLTEKVSDRSVWFMISEIYGEYSITMFYDNRKNQANGEDL